MSILSNENCISRLNIHEIHSICNMWYTHSTKPQKEEKKISSFLPSSYNNIYMMPQPKNWFWSTVYIFIYFDSFVLLLFAVIVLLSMTLYIVFSFLAQNRKKRIFLYVVFGLDIIYMKQYQWKSMDNTHIHHDTILCIWKGIVCWMIGNMMSLYVSYMWLFFFFVKQNKSILSRKKSGWNLLNFFSLYIPICCYFLT